MGGVLLVETSQAIIELVKAVCNVSIIPKEHLLREAKTAAAVLIDHADKDCLHCLRQVNERVPVVVIIADKRDSGKFIEEGADDTVRIDLIPHLLKYTILSARERRIAKIKTQRFIKEEVHRVQKFESA